jgi:5-(carboxyamino)imidazole ribonucleotide mutase
VSESENPAALPLVGVVMGSDSDLPTMRAAVDALTEFNVPSEVRILSAHRTPDVMLQYARTAAARGLRVIIAGAGGAAHLPGMIASATPLPVIGVPVAATGLLGLDALLSIVQMPAGVPVATVAIGGARNAGLLAVRILAAADPALLAAMERFQADLAAMVREKDAAIRHQAGRQQATGNRQQEGDTEQPRQY